MGDYDADEDETKPQSRARTIALAFAITLCVLVAVVAIAYGFAIVVPYIEELGDPGGRRLKLSSVATGVLAVAAVIVSTLQWLATLRALRIARQANMDNRRAHRHELRAYVSIEAGQVTFPAPQRFPTAGIRILNAGQTPAYGVEWWVGMSFAPHPEHGPLATDPGPPKISAVLGPGISVEPTVSLRSIPSGGRLMVAYDGNDAN